MNKVILVAFLAVILGCIDDTHGYYTLTTQGLTRKGEIEILLKNIIDRVQSYQDFVRDEKAKNPTDPKVISKLDAMNLMLDYLDAYKVFLSAILNTGDPTKTNPREIITAIGIFLQKIMDSYRAIEEITKQYEKDNPDVAIKVSPILNNFPEGARNIFKALTEICLINEKAALNPDPNAPLKPGEAEVAIIEALEFLSKLLGDLSFLFKDDSIDPIKHCVQLFQNYDTDLRKGVLKNLGLFSNLKSEIIFRYNVTMTASDCNYGELSDLVSDTYPGISAEDSDIVQDSINTSKKKYTDAADLIKISVLSSIDSLQALYTNDMDRVLADVNKIITTANDTLINLMTNAPDKNKLKDCLTTDGFETILANVPSSVLAAVEKFYDKLKFDETSLGVLTNHMDAFTQKVARVVIRSQNLSDMKANLTAFNEKIDVELTAKLTSLKKIELENTITTDAFKTFLMLMNSNIPSAISSLQGLIDKVKSTTYCATLVTNRYKNKYKKQKQRK